MEQCTQLLMNQVMHLYIQRSMQLFRDLKVHPGAGGMLWVLRKNNGMIQKEIAKKLGITPPSMTVMIKKLEGEGYIVKKQDEKDQRITRIFITEKGVEIAHHMESVLKELEKEAFANMSDEEIMLLRRLLLQMKENLSDKNQKGD